MAKEQKSVKKTLVISAGQDTEKITVNITVENSKGQYGRIEGALVGQVSHETQVLQSELDTKAACRWVEQRVHILASMLMAALSVQGNAGDISRMKITEGK